MKNAAAFLIINAAFIATNAVVAIVYFALANLIHAAGVDHSVWAWFIAGVVSVAIAVAWLLRAAALPNGCAS